MRKKFYLIGKIEKIVVYDRKHFDVYLNLLPRRWKEKKKIKIANGEVKITEK